MRQAPPRCAGGEPPPADAELLNAVNAGVLALDADTGELLAANDRARAMPLQDQLGFLRRKMGITALKNFFGK